MLADARLALSNLAVEISFIPVEIEMNYRVARAVRRRKKAAKEAEKKAAETMTEEIKSSVVVEEEKVETASESSTDENVTEETTKTKTQFSGKKQVSKEFRKSTDFAEKHGFRKVSEEAATKARLVDPVSFKGTVQIAKAYASHKYTRYALYYMANVDKGANLIKLDKEYQEYINGVASVFGFGKIYEEAEVADLRIYDPDCKDLFNQDAKFFVNVEQLKSYRNNEALMKLINANIVIETVNEETVAEEKEEASSTEKPVEESTTVNEEEKQEDPSKVIHPIFFTKNDENETLEEKFEKYSSDLTEKDIEKLKVFDLLLENKKFRFTKDKDLIYLYITRDLGFEECYVVDPGIVMGKGDICVLANIENDTIFVPVSEVDIVKGVLGSKFYVLTPEQTQKVESHYFRNSSIYSYVDMSHTEFLKNISNEDFQKLGKKLSFIINKLRSQNVAVIPRFRFNMWNSVDDFMIISDPTVKSPLAESAITSPVIVEGLMFIVEGDKVTQKYRDNVTEHKIEKYGDM